MMGLKRTGNYRRAGMCGLGAIAMLALEVVIGVHIITQIVASGGLAPYAWISLLFGGIFVVFALVMNALLGFTAFVLMMRERGLRAAAEHDSRGAPLATFQPDVAPALKGGETLELVRTRRKGGFGQLARALFVLVAMALLVDVIVAFLLPAINPLNHLDIFGLFAAPAPTPAPSLLDWVTLGYPVVFFLGLFFVLAPSTVIGRRQRIVVDDRGVTLDVSGRRRRFMPWNDIVVFARLSDNKSDSSVGGYLVWGREHGLALQFGASRIQSSDPELSQAYKETYAYEGGYEAYEANARRLLATIVARSFVPLRAFSGNTAILKMMYRRFPVQAVELDDVLAAPVADASLQPRPETLAAVTRPDASVTLRVRIAVLPMLVKTLIFGVVSAAAVAAIMVVPYVGKPYMMFWTDLPPLATAGIVAIGVLLVLFGGAAVAYTTHVTRYPPVSADADGLHIRTGSSNKSGGVVTMPWKDMRAWGVLPATPESKRPTTYFAFSDDQKVIWKEPADARLAGCGVGGDRRAAYRTRSEELHALIVARTGLPLKLLATGTMPETVGMATPVRASL